MTQMLGRGCRSLGVACGGHYTFKLDESSILERDLKALEPDFKQGAKQLELLYLRYDALNKEQKKIVRQFFETDGWKIKAKDFEWLATKVFRVLTEGVRPSSSSSKQKKAEEEAQKE